MYALISTAVPSADAKTITKDGAAQPPRQEELKFSSVVAVNSGSYRLTTTSADAAAGQHVSLATLNARAGEKYSVIRVGVHGRRTDKLGRYQSATQRELPGVYASVQAYLLQHGHDRIFLASDERSFALRWASELAALGITAIELMPLADFPGRRGWGYDGVLPFAPDAAYGRPEALKALIDEAHGLGMMVLVDVVYNHFGPEGNYLHACCPQFFNDAHRTPWGAAINYDGPGSATVRDFFIHNALYWVEEFHADGLRMDAVHAIRDDSPVGIVQAICDALREGPGRTREVHVVLEEDRNLAHLLERDKEGRPRIATAQWNDDLHHAAHVLLTGERDGYYADYAQRPLELFARALAEGFVYQGQASVFREGETRGEPSAALPSGAFVSYLQTHDQVGNRAFGERIDALADPVLMRAARACLLLSPHTPMLFMGEEYAAATPFPYFCDFGPELAAAVSQGRRDEFGRFAAFADEAARAAIPDCNAPESFALAKLDWSERERSPHRETLEGVRQLLQLRRERLVPHFGGRQHGGEYEVEDDLLRVRWTLSDGAVLHLLACFGEHRHAVDAPPGETLHSVGALGEAVDAASAPDEHPQRLRLARGAVHLSLQVSDVE